ncbi:MAG TPA: phosphoribosylanthranilate isomerase [Terriglobales bacterium]|nr:phosphoribosylanthranilate isomerase [Terriglobales bacterium]
MTWVKICGITNLDDALTAVDAGADALGFVFYEKSPRFVSPEQARGMIGRLPQQTETVGVFAKEEIVRCVDIASRCGLSAVQVHFSSAAGGSPGSNPELRAVHPCTRLKIYPAWPASCLINGQPLPDFRAPFDAIFLDAGEPQQPGGTGKTFDWTKAAPVVQKLATSVKVVVAGGLTATNVAEAMHILNPWGVDVSSGVEARPGKKDPDKMRTFISAVRHVDKER